METVDHVGVGCVGREGEPDVQRYRVPEVEGGRLMEMSFEGRVPWPAQQHARCLWWKRQPGPGPSPSCNHVKQFPCSLRGRFGPKKITSMGILVLWHGNAASIFMNSTNLRAAKA